MSKKREAGSVYLDVEMAICENNLEKLPGIIQMLIDTYKLDSIDDNKLDDDTERITAKKRIHETLTLAQFSVRRFIEDVEKIPIKEEAEE